MSEIPSTNGQPQGSEGQARILQLFVSAVWFGRMLERSGNQTDADIVLDAQKDSDAALTKMTTYTICHERIAAAYCAAIPGGARVRETLESMLQSSDTVFITPCKNDMNLRAES